MFHTYVFAETGNEVDFDRASFLMDRDLLKASIEAMRHERDTCPRWDAIYDAQWVWDYYCERHFETYGEYFVPDVDQTWDRPEPLPSKEPEIDLGPTRAIHSRSGTPARSPAVGTPKSEAEMFRLRARAGSNAASLSRIPRSVSILTSLPKSSALKPAPRNTRSGYWLSWTAGLTYPPPFATTCVGLALV